MITRCKQIYVYSDGSFAKEAAKGLEPLIVLRLCNDGRVVAETNGFKREIYLGKCIDAVKGLLGDGEGLIEYNRLFSDNEFNHLIYECEGFEQLELVLALFIARYRLDYSKRVADILLEE